MASFADGTPESKPSRLDFPRPPQFPSLGSIKRAPTTQELDEPASIAPPPPLGERPRTDNLSRQVNELTIEVERLRLGQQEGSHLPEALASLEQRVAELSEQLEQLRQQVESAPAPAQPAVAAAAAAVAATTEVDLDISTDHPPALGFTLDDLLRVVIKHGASDLHIKPNAAPTVRLDGDLIPIGNDILTPEQSRYLVLTSLPLVKRHRLLQRREVDHAYVCGDVRFRLNAFLERGHLSAAYRTVSSDIPGFAQLGLPQVLERLGRLNDGLVLVTGPAGSGKSTTLAALLDFINANRKAHVVTIEDPIEFHHRDKNSFITQREVGTDTVSFTEALKQALRQDPNVIMLGEMRDPETIMTAVTAAETGHLVLSTLHTPNAVGAIDRIVDSFTGQSQKQVRVLLSTCLKAVVAQKLLNRRDGGGRVPATEVMVATSTIASHILDGQTTEIHQYIEQGQNEGMHTFTQSLARLVEKGLITREDALHFADSPTDVRFATEGRVSGGVTHSNDGYINYL